MITNMKNQDKQKRENQNRATKMGWDGMEEYRIVYSPTRNCVMNSSQNLLNSSTFSAFIEITYIN